MATIQFKGNPIKTSGNLPAVGATVPDATLVKTDLSEVKLSSYPGKKVLNIFPSLDTGICAMSVRTFNKRATEKPGAKVLNISLDLPFAHKRFCTAEGIENVENLSAFRSSFADDFGVKMSEGPLKGLCSRAVLVLDESNKVVYAEQVPEITTEPNYDAALAAI
jgi:thioredoxin-dependent peroxiredoxin